MYEGYCTLDELDMNEGYFTLDELDEIRLTTDNIMDNLVEQRLGLWGSSAFGKTGPKKAKPAGKTHTHPHTTKPATSTHTTKNPAGKTHTHPHTTKPATSTHTTKKTAGGAKPGWSWSMWGNPRTHEEKTVVKIKEAHEAAKAHIAAKSGRTKDPFTDKKDFEDLELNHDLKVPSGQKNTPAACMEYVHSAMSNVIHFHGQISEEVNEFIAGNDEPNIQEVSYWIKELNKVNSELTNAIHILTKLKPLVQKNPQDVITGLKELFKDDVDIKSKFNVVVKDKRSPSKDQLIKWQKRMAIMKKHLETLEGKLGILGTLRKKL
jgi:hypothetical protein